MNEYIDNLNGKNIALKANEYAKDKDPYRQEIEDLYAALWHHHTEEPVNERRNETLFIMDLSNPFIPRYTVSNYTDINWKNGHKFRWAYADDIMSFIRKIMRLNDRKNEDQ